MQLLRLCRGQADTGDLGTGVSDAPRRTLISLIAFKRAERLSLLCCIAPTRQRFRAGAAMQNLSHSEYFHLRLNVTP